MRSLFMMRHNFTCYK